MEVLSKDLRKSRNRLYIALKFDKPFGNTGKFYSYWISL